VLFVRRVLGLSVALLAMTIPAAPAGSVPEGDAAAKRYRGYISVGRGATHSGVQGDGWRAVFRERVRGRVRYKVCLRYLEQPSIRRCWRRTTSSRGRSSVFVALFVNDRGGVGRWRARWRARGKRVASWTFRVRSEGV
jgi:hypothetical protein